MVCVRRDWSLSRRGCREVTLSCTQLSNGKGRDLTRNCTLISRRTSSVQNTQITNHTTFTIERERERSSKLINLHTSEQLTLYEQSLLKSPITLIKLSSTLLDGSQIMYSQIPIIREDHWHDNLG